MTRRVISARSDARFAQRIGEVLEDGQVRVEGEGLEDHRHAAPGDRRVGHVAAENLDAAAVRPDEPGDGAQRRRLADGARAENDEETPFGDLQSEVVQSGHSRIFFRYAAKA